MTPERKRKIRRWALEIAAAVILVLGLRAFMTRGAVSGRAPMIDGRATDGQRVSLASMRGRPVLVHFWATWCGVCRAQEGNIESVAEGGDVITIATRSGDATVVGRELQARGLHFAAIVDPDGRIASAWGVRAFPTDFVVGPDGDIAFTDSGYTTTLGLRLRLWSSALF